MAIETRQFREPKGLNVFADLRRTEVFPEMRRVPESWSAAAERRALLGLAPRTPEWIGPDHLTPLGLVGQIGAGFCYVLARSNQYAPLGVTILIALNWLGDALDGALARRRRKLLPRYGFYADHMVDTFRALALMGGLAMSGLMHPWVAMGLRSAFVMLSIQSYLAAHLLGEFRLSFWRFGPTELRILLAIGSLALPWKPQLHFIGGYYRLVDVGGAIGLAGMALMPTCFTLQNTLRLSREEQVSE